MPTICLMTKSLLTPDFIPLSIVLQHFIDNELRPAATSMEDTPIYICLVDETTHAPYRVLTPEHIILSMAKAEEIGTYIGLTLNEYMKLCLCLALVQQRALSMNPLLKPEDMVHPAHEYCLFNQHLGGENFAVQLEKMIVCQGCRDFYHCLGCDREMENLQKRLGGPREKTIPKKTYT